MEDEKLSERLRVVKKYLKNYEYIEIDIEGLELEKNILFENNTYGITAVNFDTIKVSKTNKVNKQLENEVIEFIERIKNIVNKIAELKVLKGSLDTAIKKLPPIQQDVIKRGCIKGVSWGVIGKENLITQKTLRKFKQEALKAISDSLSEKGY